MLGNKTLRSMENTLHRNRKQHNENRDFCFFHLFFFSRTKTLKRMQNTILGERENHFINQYENTKRNEKKRPFCVFSAS